MVRAGVLQPYDKQPAASALDVPHRVEDKQALFEMCEMFAFCCRLGREKRHFDLQYDPRVGGRYGHCNCKRYSCLYGQLDKTITSLC